MCCLFCLFLLREKSNDVKKREASVKVVFKLTLFRTSIIVSKTQRYFISASSTEATAYALSA